jgi:hypothetical protein
MQIHTVTHSQETQKMCGILPEPLYPNERSRNGTTRAEKKRVDICSGPAKELGYDIIALIHPWTVYQNTWESIEVV